MSKLKTIKMFKNGRWVKWDGSDVKQLVIEEEVTLEQAIKYGYRPATKQSLDEGDKE